MSYRTQEVSAPGNVRPRFRPSAAIVDPETERIASQVVDAAVKLHIRFGPGLLESVYQTFLAGDLARRGLEVEVHKPIPIEYAGMRVDVAFRPDLLVNGRLVVELKSVRTPAEVHFKQVSTYIRVLELPLGLLINFGEPTLKKGLHRVLNNHLHLTPRASP